MILDLAESRVIASVTRNRRDIWLYDLVTTNIEIITMYNNPLIELYYGINEYFSVRKMFQGENRIEISVYSFANLLQPQAQASIRANVVHFSGESDVWRYVPLVYVAYLELPGEMPSYVLTILKPDTNSVDLQPMRWYYADAMYDPERTAPWDVIAIPETQLVLISIEGADGVLYNIETHHATKISLGGTGGNRKLFLRAAQNEIWTLSRNALVRINLSDFTIVNMLNVQTITGGVDTHRMGSFTGTAGEFVFNHDQSLCAVARVERGRYCH